MKIKLYYDINDCNYYNIIIKQNNKIVDNKKLLNDIEKQLLNENFRLYFNEQTGEYWTFDRIIRTKEKDYNLIFDKVVNNDIYFNLEERND